MMASTWSRYHFLTQRFSLGLLLSLVLTLTWPFTVTGSRLPGEVGGNVTFHCSGKSVKHIDFLYLQKDNVFVNGYHASKELRTTWNNTKFDQNTSSVFMDNLKVSHSGEYKCLIRYKDEQHINEDSITLNVTAKYSRPVFSPPVCDKETQGQNCQTTCTSNNGYPKSSMIIQAIVTSTNDTIRQTWEHVKSVQSPNSSTLLYNIATTVSYNCSNGEIKFSCSVGDVTSDEISVCAHQTQHGIDIVIVTAIFILVVVVVMIAGFLCWRRRTGGSMRLERVNTNEA
ncbi:uncharacterized protein LOC100706994 isoform X2 [Oreochromis niloticus]|nr:uncharacterized protein LOC100706994 isoform X2 [Oreochromis niloticus]